MLTTGWKARVAQAAKRRRGTVDRRPLRKIVGTNAGKEVLECGHEQRPREDFVGVTNASRRRCDYCPKRVAPTDGETK